MQIEHGAITSHTARSGQIAPLYGGLQGEPASYTEKAKGFASQDFDKAILGIAEKASSFITIVDPLTLELPQFTGHLDLLEQGHRLQ